MWKLKWCLDRVVQSVFLEWSLSYMVLFQAPFSFASCDFVHGNVWKRNVLWPLDCTCRPLWLYKYKAIHVDQVRQELHHGNGSKPQWWMNLVKQKWHCGRFLCYAPLLVFWPCVRSTFMQLPYRLQLCLGTENLGCKLWFHSLSFRLIGKAIETFWCSVLLLMVICSTAGLLVSIRMFFNRLLLIRMFIAH